MLRLPVACAWLCCVQGVTTGIAYQHGVGSSAFALAVALSSIVMYDAAGVRRHAGAAGGTAAL
jgi:acid phosphatase family membrane protein YuiD